MYPDKQIPLILTVIIGNNCLQMKKIALLLGLTATFLSMTDLAYSQVTESSYRGSVQADIKLTKKLHWMVEPEYRFSNEDSRSLLLQTGLNYRLTSWFNVGAYYRMQGEWTQDADNNDETSFEFYNRFAFDANTKVKLSRFTPKVRVRFCNFSDFDSQTDDKSNYLRYRAGLSYNIRGCSLTPSVSAEWYEKLNSGSWNKVRYSVGLDYAITKHHAISLEYSRDEKFKSETSYNIFEVSYKIDF